MRKFFSLFVAALFSATMFADTWTVAGAPASVFGSEWAPSNTDNDMTLVDGLYTLVKEGVTAPAGNVEFKVVKNHAWSESYPGSNYKLAIAEDGQYDITITFNESTKEVNATAVKKGSVVIEKHPLVVGEAAIVNGAGWQNDNTDNLMVSSDGGLTYVLTIAGLELSARDYEYKIVENGSWTAYYDNGAGGNVTFNIAEEGIYTITYTFTVASSTCVVTTTKTGELHIAPKAAAKGSWDSWAAEVAFVTDGEEKTATGEVQLTAGTDYEFKMIINDAYRGNGYTYHRDFTGADGISSNGSNMVLQADVTGKYIITWTFATDAIQITFPAQEPTAISNTAVEGKAQKSIENGMLIIRRDGKSYNVLGTVIR